MITRRRSAIVTGAIVACLALWACTPYRISRIGPTRPAKPSKCAVELLEDGQLPDRPYQDVGVIELQYCPDYLTGSCRGWTREAACELGGDVVYHERTEREPFERDPVVYRLNVAAYVDAVRDMGDAEGGCDTDPKKMERCLE